MAARATGAKSSTRSKAAIEQLSWSTARPAPVVLVSGPEEFLAGRAIGRIRDLLRAADPALEVSDIEADNYAVGELATLASPSLFAEPRLIRVSNVEKCNDAFLDEALRYLDDPAPDTCVVLRHAGGMRGKKLLDTVRSGTGGGVEVVCTELKRDSDKVDFANAEFAAAGRRVAPGAVRALVTAFSDDISELAAACRQLIADSTGDVTESTVERYYAGRVETNAFKVADAAIAGRAGEALTLLRHALASGADPVPVVAAFASKIRTMAKVAGSRGRAAELAGRLGLAPWMVERAQRDLQGWSEEGLARSIEFIAETDAQVKGAGRDPEFALERMVRVVSSRGTAH